MSKKKAKKEGGGGWIWGLLVDTLCGYCFWTFALSLLDAIFFFPLFDMALSGFEMPLLAALTIVSSLLMFDFGRTFVRKHYPFLFFLSASGFLCHLPGAQMKIVFAFFGFIFLFMACTGIVSSPLEERRSRWAYGMLLGSLFLSIVKSAGLSLLPHIHNPIFAWVPMGLIALGSLYYYFETKSLSSSISSPSKVEKTKKQALLGSLQYSANLFLIYKFCTSPNVLCRWVNLNPYPYQIVPVLATGLGILLGNSYFPNSIFHLLVGVGGGFVLCQFDGMIGLLGGCAVILFVLSSFHHSVHHISSCPLPTFTLANFFFFVHVLELIWSVAYNFVPLGWILRERIGLLLAFWILCIGSGNIFGSFSQSLPAFKRKYFKKVLLAVILIFLVAGVPTLMSRMERHNLPPPSPREAELLREKVGKASPDFTSMIWTVHFGYDNVGGNNFDGAVELIEDAGIPDVIGLLETDMARVFMGNRDLVEYLSETFHYYSNYGPSTKKSTWGCALLSRYPIVRAEEIILPSPEGELACLVDATIRFPPSALDSSRDVKENEVESDEGREVDFLVTHFGVWEDPLDRELQAKEVARIVEEEKEGNKTIFMGYVTAPPYIHPNYKKVLSTGLVDSLPRRSSLARRWKARDRWCQYIFYKDLSIVDFARQSVGRLSDTEWQKGFWRL